MKRSFKIFYKIDYFKKYGSLETPNVVQPLVTTLFNFYILHKANGFKKEIAYTNSNKNIFI
ncbi:hypothetical protein ACSYG2_11280 [Leptospira interrogans serovar Icterohaemorrhagiae]|uniref:Uncharacterized protein n=1 Tax=Leptospira interrogans serogroup Icterohaemorrhagiae serovar Lai (strain 56601) TaxID=189518 RepID=Q8F5S6_LEPIN|nr:hypothetical protein [Leptospira interrogans]AAN48790.1 hypothetical protein LA_1591 [Leptospira interrogans serovar Lai str. 56601]AER02077.1 hypothetical protein LIF_A1278 [Leptospira interrogans serovar Lai str. IPAV]EMJ54272.1 hypothetical protein LEP1GSC111_0847 [Leptospira interrogans str. UT126]KGE25986.1 hypothetical protein IQ65_12715 [Leptospira interrogans serovar Lai]MBE0305556.1 hypothetical protein [Leptospira interrogans serovar Yeoncheon]QOI34866.1 hypothetical protein Lept